MLASLKSATKRLLNQCGLDVRRTDPDEWGRDPFQDMARLLTTTSQSQSGVVFDVGANEGQTIRRYRSVFPEATIHAFEPGQVAYQRLTEQFASMPKVILNHCALGSEPGSKLFHENEMTDMSSFLATGREGWGATRRDIEVNVETLDRYCRDHSLATIDILKSDTQGYDLEVLRGASTMLTEGRIRLVYLEITFLELYVGMPGPDEIYRLLSNAGYQLVSFYRFHYKNRRAGWSDALFAHKTV
jgi:FkbM family methyltransferase